MLSTIRVATRDDLDTILQMMEDWVAEDITWGQQATVRDYLEKQIGPLFLVAEHATKIIEYTFGNVVASPLAVFRDDPYLNIEEIYVIPIERCRGIGGVLLTALMKGAEETGVHQFHVFSATKDQDRIAAFYERHGFRTWGTQLYRTS